MINITRAETNYILAGNYALLEKIIDAGNAEIALLRKENATLRARLNDKSKEREKSFQNGGG